MTATEVEDLDVFDAEVHTMEQAPDIQEYLPAGAVRDQEQAGYNVVPESKGPFGSLAWNMTPEGGEDFVDQPWSDAESFAPMREEMGIDRVLFAPGLAFFGHTIPDRSLRVPYMRAVNEYMVDNFVRVDDVHYGHAFVLPDQPQASAEEIDRLADEDGIVSVFCPSNTEFPLGHDRYAPLLEAAERNGLPIILHGDPKVSNTFPSELKLGSYFEHHTLCHPMAHMRHMVSLVGQEVLETHDIDIGFWEAGLSWVEFMMHRMDRDARHRPTDVAGLSRRPSEYVQEFHFNTQPLEAFRQPEEFGAFLERTGLEEQVLFSTDMPHPDRDTVGTIRDHAGLTDEQKRLILQDNADGLFGL